MTKIQALAEEWIAQESESSKLLGAAWLLTGTKRNLAIETLEHLAKTSKSPMIVAYAKAQLWRTVPPAEILSDRYPRWLAERDKLLLPAQAGPPCFWRNDFSKQVRQTWLFLNGYALPPCMAIDTISRPKRFPRPPKPCVLAVAPRKRIECNRCSIATKRKKTHSGDSVRHWSQASII